MIETTSKEELFCETHLLPVLKWDGKGNALCYKCCGLTESQFKQEFPELHKQDKVVMKRASFSYRLKRSLADRNLKRKKGDE